MEWYLKVLKDYATFDGRARRKEYWMFFLFNLIVSVLIAVADAMLGLNSGGFGILGSLYALAVLLPSIALGARRLHDIDRSGWWQLLGLVPILGWIVLLIWAVSEGTRGSNRFGPDPKADEGGVPAMA